MSDKVIKSLEKIFGYLGSTRLWTYLIGLAVVIGVLPATVDPDVMSKDIVAAIMLIVQGVTALVGIVTLLIEYTKRPPSGLDFKVDPEVTEIAKTFLAAVKDQKK